MNGRRILVTGGAKRLGREIVMALAHAGAAVAIHAKPDTQEATTLATQLQAQGHVAGVVAADLAKADEVATLVSRAAALLGGPLDGLVNNASVFDYDRPAAFDAEMLTRLMTVNLAAPLILSQHLFDQADAARDTVIVDLLDQKLWNLNPDFFSYTLTKSALHAAVTMRAMAFAPKVRVCGVAPGIIYPSFDQSEAEFAHVAAGNLAHRAIDPAHVAQAVLMLFGNPALTGQILHADNGQHLVASNRDVMFSTRPNT